jgi:cephalosporin-C deacetylase-like acetyl esterase
MHGCRGAQGCAGAAVLVFTLVLASCAEDTTVSLEKFYEYDRDFPLDPQVRLVENAADHALHHITYLSTHDSRVTGLLSLPKPASGPVPVIIFLHGLRDSKSEDYMQVGNRIFLRNGYAVLRIDAQNHGERKRHDLKLDLTQGYPYWSRGVVIQSVFDLRRAVDFIASRPELDSSRVAFFGASFGGFVGTVFVGVDERVKAAVIALAGGGLNLLFGVQAASPKVDEFLSVVEPLNFVGRISPRPLLMLNAKQDETVPPIAARWLYARAGEPKKIIWYDTQHHEIPMEPAFGEAVEWFDRYLQ